MSRVPILLIADGDRPTLLALRRAFLLDGYNVLLAHNGEQLLELIDEGRTLQPPAPDLILTDAELPLRAGLDIIETLRGHDSHTPIVLTTALRTHALVAKAKALRVQAVFDKPFDPEDLRSVVALLLTRPASAPVAQG